MLFKIKNEPFANFIINRIKVKYPAKQDKLLNNEKFISAAAALAIEAAALIKQPTSAPNNTKNSYSEQKTNLKI